MDGKKRGSDKRYPSLTKPGTVRYLAMPGTVWYLERGTNQLKNDFVYKNDGYGVTGNVYQPVCPWRGTNQLIENKLDDTGPARQKNDAGKYGLPRPGWTGIHNPRNIIRHKPVEKRVGIHTKNKEYKKKKNKKRFPSNFCKSPHIPS
jgi:hypothetical protein